MSGPGKAISKDWEKKQEHWIPSKKEKQKKCNNATSAQKMELSAHDIRVFSKVKSVEIRKVFEFHYILLLISYNASPRYLKKF
jgi:hypothetical protein